MSNDIVQHEVKTLQSYLMHLISEGVNWESIIEGTCLPRAILHGYMLGIFKRLKNESDFRIIEDYYCKTGGYLYYPTTFEEEMPL